MTDNYEVDFPMFAKIDVNGEDEAELYTIMKSQQPGDIGWNFEKFLIDPSGNAIARWGTAATPEEIAADLPGLMNT